MGQTAGRDLEDARLERLRGTGLLDSAPEPGFDRVTRLAARLLRSRVALVSLVDRDRQFFKSAVGLPASWVASRETPLSHSFCRRVVTRGRPLVVADARAVPELRAHPAVAELGVVAYLGMPLTTADGFALGALCVADPAPRAWAADDVATLADLAATVMTEIGLREQLARSERDVAERRRAEARLRVNEQTLRAVFDATFQFIGLLAPDGTLLRANRASLEFAGVAHDAVAGRPFPETPWWSGSEAARVRLRAAIAEAARGGFVRFEAEHPAPDGGAITVDFSISPVRDESGRVTQLIAEGRDLSDRRRAEDALREADRRKDEFLAVLAHELRNPLAAVSHAVRVLELRDAEPALRAQMRDLIVVQTRTLTRLVDDLLDVARIARGKVRLRPEPLDLAEAVGRAAATTRPLMHLRNHRLTLDLPAAPVVLRADALRLEQVLVNLLTNAAKYTDPGGRIAVVASPEGGSVRVAVVDDGAGIAPELLPRVFDQFTQADQTLDRSRGGLGVGLTLVRGLVALHGGTIEAFSAGIGRGSEFVLHLPLAGPPDGEGEADAPVAAVPVTDSPPGPRAGRARAPAGGGPKRVLVIDDNVTATEALVLILRHWGHTVHACHDGRAGLDAAAAFRPDVVLLDIGLPGLDGHDVARHLRARPEHRNTVLVAVTGYGRDEDRLRSRDAGLDHHFVKPIDLDALESFLADPHLAPRPAPEGIPGGAG